LRSVNGKDDVNTLNTPELMQKLQSSQIYVDEEGDWFNEGMAMTREDILQLFLENVQELADGSYVIAWGGNLCSLRVEDTPFVIARVDHCANDEPTEEQFLIKLKHHPQPQTLDPGTLRTGADNILYCRLRESGYRARFSRPAYYQLAQWIEEDSETGGFSLCMGANRYPIRMEP
jgi:uncharacterized protein